MGLKTGDLNLQGQIGLKTSTVFAKNGTVCHNIFKLERYIDHLLVPSRGWLGGGGEAPVFGECKKALSRTQN